MGYKTCLTIIKWEHKINISLKNHSQIDSHIQRDNNDYER